MVSAIILAAGESQRMGKPKQLLAFGGSTILEEVINNLLNSKVSEVVVVLGYEAEEIANKIARKPVKKIKNPNYWQGMSSSIRWGLTSVDEKADAILIALGDQPLIPPIIFNRLIDEHYRNKKGITIPVYKGIRGHPIIFDIKYKKELMGLTGDIGGREIIGKHPEDVLEIEVDSESVIKDVDDMEEYLYQLRSFC